MYVCVYDMCIYDMCLDIGTHIYIYIYIYIETIVVIYINGDIPLIYSDYWLIYDFTASPVPSSAR